MAQSTTSSRLDYLTAYVPIVSANWFINGPRDLGEMLYLDVN